MIINIHQCSSSYVHYITYNALYSLNWDEIFNTTSQNKFVNNIFETLKWQVYTDNQEYVTVQELH